MGGQESKAHVSTSSNAIHPRRRIAQNFFLIWVDASIDQSTEDYQNTLAQLQSVVNDVNIFTQPDQCIQFLNDIQDEKAFVITSGSLGQHFVPDIHGLPQLHAIYIFCGDVSRHEIWTKEWLKIKGIYTDIDPICQALQAAAKQCNQDSIAVSFVMASEGASSQNLNQLESTFMYNQIFKDILLEMEYDNKSIKDLVKYCREIYNDNMVELTIIDEFEHNYRPRSAIWWYTRQCFIYQMLNHALRTLQGDIIINMSFFICDLHKQIEELHQEQVGSNKGKVVTVYRGQGLLTSDFEKLQRTKSVLMSFNNFLSTSTVLDVSMGFAKGTLTNNNMVGVLFKMTINPTVSSTPFASIQNVSYVQTDEEILFPMHTVFRVDEITQIDENNPLYQVDLTLAADDDPELCTLTTSIREEVAGETGWKRLGQLLMKISKYDKADELYNVLLEQTSDLGEKALYYNQLGYIKNHQGDYKKAIEYYKKALEIWGKILPPNYPLLATSCNNIGNVYNNRGEYSKALSFYEKTHEIFEKTLPPNHPDLATSYNNIGSVYKNMAEYSKALSFYEKDLDICQKTLPSNHPSLATSYNNIAGVYYNTKEYAKSLSFFECVLNIFQSSLPSNHPNIKTVQGNIENVKKKLKLNV